MIAWPPLSAPPPLRHMATAATTSGGAPKLSHRSPSHHRLKSTRKLNGSTKFLIHIPTHFSLSRPPQLPLTVQASNDSQMQDQDSTSDNNTAASTSQEDLKFLWKVGAGSFVGAAVIKYGSILFPEITRPNLLQALVMILTPVIVAVGLLIKQSRAEKQS